MPSSHLNVELQFNCECWLQQKQTAEPPHPPPNHPPPPQFQPPSLHQSDLNPDPWSFPEKVGEFLFLQDRNRGKQYGGKAAEHAQMSLFGQERNKERREGVLDKTGGGRNICLHFPGPTAASSSSSSSSHGRQQPAEKID